jgi:hypothetical protein
MTIIGSGTNDGHWQRFGRYCPSYLACFQVWQGSTDRVFVTNGNHRRQTLAFKGFIVSACKYVELSHSGSAHKDYKQVAISGLVFGAESALQQHETVRRREENVIRREARLDLARRGLVATETEIANWKAEKERQQSTSTNTSSQPSSE